MSLLQKKHHRTIVIIFCLIAIIPTVFYIIQHWNRTPIVGDYLVLEVLFFTLAELVYLLKNYTK